MLRQRRLLPWWLVTATGQLARGGNPKEAGMTQGAGKFLGADSLPMEPLGDVGDEDRVADGGDAGWRVAKFIFCVAIASLPW